MSSKQVVWSSLIVRHARDIAQMSRSAAAGDRLCRGFFLGLGQWLKQCRQAPAGKAPLCLTCEHEFSVDTLPFTFMLTYSEDPRAKHIALTGVCARCAQNSDAELLKRGGELAAKVVDGRVLGLVGPSPSQDAH